MSFDSEYWRNIVSMRVSRRRALAGATAFGAGAAALGVVGCGGGDTGEVASRSNLGQVEDTTRQAVVGGVAQDFVTTEIQTFDLARTSNFTAFNNVGFTVYSRLFKLNSGPKGENVTAKFDGDLVESWEVLDGGTRWVLKLRPDVKMQPVAPLNRRALDVEDVTLSWQRFIEGSPRRVRFDMVESLQATDNRTIVIRNKFPYAPFGLLLADYSAFWIQPKEVAKGEVDYRAAGAGSGPYIIDEYRRGAFLRWKRHPEYFLKGLPYIETIEMPIITEYAQRLAQFKAGNIDIFTPNPTDVLTIRADVPDATMWQGEFTLSQNYVLFPRTDPIFNGFKGDARIRRALSMAFDRDTFIDVFRNVTNVRNAGFAVDVKWDNLVTPGWPSYLDPQSKEMGWPDKAPGLWYKFDIAEAKKLLAAAGYPNGIDSEIHYSTIWTGDFRNRMEATRDMWAQAGFRFRLVGHEFQTDYLPNVIEKGDFKGVRVGPFTEYVDEDTYLRSAYLPGTDRNPAGYDDPRLTQMIEQQRREFDWEKRKAILWDIQKYLSDNMWNIPWGGQATSGFAFTQPWVMNYRLYRQSPNAFLYRWIDQSKKRK